MHWPSTNLQWLIGIVIAVIGVVIALWPRDKPGQNAKTGNKINNSVLTSSPVASGSGITQNVTTEHHYHGEPRTQPVHRQEWKEMAEKFEQTHKSSVSCRADWTETTTEGIASAEWRLAGAANAGNCEALCKLAGAMLLKSPNILPTLSDNTKGQTDNLSRWLYFLKDEKRVQTSTLVGTSKYKDMVTQDGTFQYLESTLITPSIEYLARVSAQTCLECAADET